MSNRANESRIKFAWIMPSAADWRRSQLGVKDLGVKELRS